jgi:predicted nuclease with TOPRIM domain
VAAARRDAGKKATGSAFNDDYFKDPHWSYEYRTDFEKWVKEQLRLRDDTDLFGNFLKESLGIPLWLEDIDLPTEVTKYINGLAEENKNLNSEKTRLEARVNKLETKILGLRTMTANLTDREDAIESHHKKGSVRTIHINLEEDIDLSQADFHELLKRI